MIDQLLSDLQSYLLKIFEFSQCVREPTGTKAVLKVTLKEAKEGMNKQSHAFGVRFYEHLRLDRYFKGFLKGVQISTEQTQGVEKYLNFLFHYFCANI